jgi:hypothetical protein
MRIIKGEIATSQKTKDKVRRKWLKISHKEILSSAEIEKRGDFGLHKEKDNEKPLEKVEKMKVKEEIGSGDDEAGAVPLPEV